MKSTVDTKSVGLTGAVVGQPELGDDTLVTDHGIDNLTLHQDYDGNVITYAGVLHLTREVGFEASFPANELIENKSDVRGALIASARYLDDGSVVNGYVAMNATFKALIKRILADSAEMNKETA